ncbi:MULTISPECIES: flavin reductase family protein [Rhizobium]|uniref:flavin reductase family protein n=1 Tax=Rhizobium TaxID=379 RepID=UPI000BE9C9F1|nr:flavin reductase family protein [Rhizobium anhuiense]NKM55916.1 flavin reductase family protein [Rhizobium anhuiense]PDS66660.1 flavin reductase [Rhizobium anhuiense]
MKEISASQAYRLLEPGPIVLVTTSLEGTPNVMTMGFHMMVQHAPPLIGCVIGPWDFSHQTLKKTGECVIAIPATDLAETVVDIGNCSGDTVDKFERFGLGTRPAKDVAAPLLVDCLANIECRLADPSLVDRYNLFILEAKRIWIDETRKERRTMHHRGDGSFTVDGGTLDLRKRMVKWRHLP